MQRDDEHRGGCFCIRVLDECLGNLRGDPVVDRSVKGLCSDANGFVGQGTRGGGGRTRCRVSSLLSPFCFAIPSLGTLSLDIVRVEGKDVETEMGAQDARKVGLSRVVKTTLIFCSGTC